jgi:hypothetical protein
MEIGDWADLIYCSSLLITVSVCLLLFFFHGGRQPRSDQVFKSRAHVPVTVLADSSMRNACLVLGLGAKQDRAGATCYEPASVKAKAFPALLIPPVLALADGRGRD